MILRKLVYDEDCVYIEGTEDPGDTTSIMLCLTTDGRLRKCDGTQGSWYTHKHIAYELDGKVLLAVINNLIEKGVIRERKEP